MNLKYAKRSEDTEQIRLMEWCRNNENRYPELRWCFHIPNGGSAISSRQGTTAVYATRQQQR